LLLGADIVSLPRHVRLVPLATMGTTANYSFIRSTTGAIDRTRGAPQGVKFEESLLRFADEVALAIFRLTINSNLVG
jgi:hypothetical protein